MKHASSRSRVVRWLFVLIVPVLGVAPRRARANGAFPDSLGPLLPPDRPNEIMLATTFGIVLSEDAGQTWTYSCERLANGMSAAQYQLGPAPRNRLFALTDVAFIYSDDRACTWTKAQGLLAGKPAFDYFPDPGNPDRVWAVRGPDAPDAGGSLTYSVVESTDGGANFTATRYTAAAGDVITGVEIARSDGNTAYLTLRSGPTFVPKMVVTSNGGTSWATRDLSTKFANASLRIVSIDPGDAGKIFLRVSSTGGASSVDAIALSLDGGANFVSPNPLSVADGALKSFVRLSSGTLLVAGVRVVSDVIYRSTNGGTSFEELAAPAVNGVGQRDGRVFLALATNNDPAAYALGVSNDEGGTWQPVMAFDQIQAISACAKAICQADCMTRASLGTWEDAVCSADPAPLPVDGGAPADARGAGGAAGNPGTGGGAPKADAAVDASAPKAPTSGCHCRAAGGDDGAPAASQAVLALVLAALIARRRRRGSAR
jgi:MYXO-CTERM domain-containing protein